MSAIDFAARGLARKLELDLVTAGPGKGAALIAAHAGASVDDILQGFATRTAMKALTPANGDRVFLSEAGRAGEFVFSTANLSAEVAADTAEGVYIAPDSDSDGSSGAWVRQYDGPLHLQWFGAVGDGATDDSAAIQCALDVCQMLLVPLRVPGKSYRCSGLTTTGYTDIAGEPGATFLYASNEALLNIEPARSAAQVVSATGTATLPAAGGTTVSTITVAGGAWAAGDVVHIYSTSDDHPCIGWTAGDYFVGETAYVAEVNGNVLTLTEVLIHTYTNDVFIAKLGTDRVSLKGFEVDCYEDPYGLGAPPHYAAIEVVGAVDADIDISFAASYGVQLQLISCVRGRVTGHFRNGRDDSGNSQWGYGVLASGACSDVYFYGLTGHRVRHAFTTVLYNNGEDASIGSQKRLVVDGGYAAFCTGASWDTHPGAYDCLFINLVAERQQPTNDDDTGGGLWSFQDRACRSTWKGCMARGHGNGWYMTLSGAAWDYGINFTARLIDCCVERGDTYFKGYTSEGGAGIAPNRNYSGDTIVIFLERFTTRQVKEPFSMNNDDVKPKIIGNGCAFHDATLYRFGGNLDMELYGCIQSYRGGSSAESIRSNGGALTLVNHTIIGTSPAANVVKVDAGTLTLKAHNVVKTGVNFAATSPALVDPAGAGICTVSHLAQAAPGPSNAVAYPGDANHTVKIQDPEQIVYNTTLTANRTVTLSSTGMPDGKRFKVTRLAGGAFTLTVNGSGVAVNEWIEFTHIRGSGFQKTGKGVTT